MSIHDCCGTTCDRDAVINELRQLREFKARTLELLRAAAADRQSLGDLSGGSQSVTLDQQTPVAVTRYRNVDAYLLPERMVRELLIGVDK